MDLRYPKEITMRKMINRLRIIRSYRKVKKIPRKYCKRLAKCPQYSDCQHCELFQPNIKLIDSNLLTHPLLKKSSNDLSTELISNIPNPENIIPYLRFTSHKIITDIAISTKVRISEIINLSIGDLRSIQAIKHGRIDLLSNNVEEAVYYLRFIGKSYRKQTAILHLQTINDILNFCNNERKINDLTHRCLDELNDTDKIFINKNGGIFSSNTFNKDWKQACLNSGLNFKPNQIRHLYPPSINQRFKKL
jgi:hypothetical protein